MKNCIIIPARYNSKRLPGKPLININGEPLIVRTIKKLKKKFDIKNIYVCTDNKKVADVLKNVIKGNTIIIKKNCLNGAERCSWAFEKINKKYDYATIVSCDMPFINSDIIKTLEYKATNDKSNADGFTVHAKISDHRITREKAIAKIVVSKNNRILYLSRAGIPYPKNFIEGKFFSHHGIVMLKKDVLKKYKYLNNTSLQLIEDNEWLKLIEHDYVINSYLHKKIKPEINTRKDIKEFFPIKI